MRAPRGYSCPVLLGREAMASVLAACRKNFPAAYRLHARAKPVRFGAASLARLICALWQNSPPLLHATGTRNGYTRSRGSFFHPLRGHTLLAASAAACELSSVLDRCVHGQETGGGACREGKNDPPCQRIKMTLPVTLIRAYAVFDCSVNEICSLKPRQPSIGGMDGCPTHASCGINITDWIRRP